MGNCIEAMRARIGTSQKFTEIYKNVLYCIVFSQTYSINQSFSDITFCFFVLHIHYYMFGWLIVTYLLSPVLIVLLLLLIGFTVAESVKSLSILYSLIFYFLIILLIAQDPAAQQHFYRHVAPPHPQPSQPIHQHDKLKAQGLPRSKLSLKTLSWGTYQLPYFNFFSFLSFHRTEFGSPGVNRGLPLSREPLSPILHPSAKPSLLFFTITSFLNLLHNQIII